MVKIGICDDDVGFTGTMEALLDKVPGLQAEVKVFFDGETLLKSFQKGEGYDLIFLDIEMERTNGVETGHRIREYDKTVLLIYVSGYEQYLIQLFEIEPFRVL